MKKTVIFVTILMFVFVSTSAVLADDNDNGANNSLLIPSSINVGGLSVFTIEGERILDYTYFGLSWFTPLFERLSLISSISLETSPKAGNWGLVGTVVVDYSLNSRLGVDGIMNLVHDEDPLLKLDLGDATTFYYGGGVGISIFLENKIVISPAVLFLHGTDVDEWVIDPIINISAPLP